MATLNLSAFQTPSKAPAVDPKLDWQKLDIATLSPDLQEAYQTMAHAQAKANTARKAFEAAMNDKIELPAHLSLAFTYRFGLAIAIAPKRKPAKPALSLSDLVARANRA